jgi:hypothetical protein
MAFFAFSVEDAAFDQKVIAAVILKAIDSM